MVDRFAGDWRTAGLDEETLAVLEYTEKLTRHPGEMGPADVERLRATGLSDRAITDVAQVCSYFNYINRIADGLGVDDEEWIDDLGRPIA
jgi:uncharacterized peroxidase-related enzyme